MLCEHCGQNHAEVHLVKIVNGERHYEHVCRECARRLLPFDEAAQMMKMTFSLEGMMDLQEALKDLLLPVLPELYGEERDIVKCPHCGAPLPKELFDEPPKAAPAKGDAPLFIPPLDERAELKKEMERAVREERYERAAEIRDRLRELEEKKTEKGA